MQTIPWILATYVPLEIAYVLLVWNITGRLSRSVLASNRWTAIPMIAIAAVLTSGMAVLAGQLWAIAVEIVRVGDGHLGRRTQFIPYLQIQQRMFVFGVAAFVVTALVRRLHDSGPVIANR